MTRPVARKDDHVVRYVASATADARVQCTCGWVAVAHGLDADARVEAAASRHIEAT
jgi:hypothetical protein